MPDIEEERLSKLEQDFIALVANLSTQENDVQPSLSISEGH